MINREKLLQLEQRMNEQVLGQEELVRMLIVALLCDGHVLLEGLPGLAKTRAVRELARHVEGDYRRIQFTPDLLPSDITGSEIYQQNATREEDQFRFRPGPVFGNITTAPRPACSPRCSKPWKNVTSPWRAKAGLYPVFLWFWPRKTQWIRKVPGLCRKPSWTVF